MKDHARDDIPFVASFFLICGPHFPKHLAPMGPWDLGLGGEMRGANCLPLPLLNSDLHGGGSNRVDSVEPCGTHVAF